MGVLTSIRESRMTRFQVISVAVALSLFFVDGLDVAVMAYVAPALSREPGVVIGVSESLAVLADRDSVVDGSPVAIARTGVCLAVAHDAPRPALGTVPDLCEALLAARSVAYSRIGASGIYFARLLEKLDIATAVNARATVVEKGFTALAILDGRADLAVQQLSELKFVREVDVVGPFPEEVQHYTEFSAGIGAKSVHPAGEQLITHHISPVAGARYAEAGLAALRL